MFAAYVSSVPSSLKYASDVCRTIVSEKEPMTENLKGKNNHRHLKTQAYESRSRPDEQRASDNCKWHSPVCTSSV